MLLERNQNSSQNSALTLSRKSSYKDTKNPVELGKHVYILPWAKKREHHPSHLWTDSLGFWLVTILRKQSLAVQHWNFMKTPYVMLLSLFKQTHAFLLDLCQLWGHSWHCHWQYQGLLYPHFNLLTSLWVLRIYFSRGNSIRTTEVQKDKGFVF